MEENIEKKDESLNASEMGTKDYWDSIYELEIQNYLVKEDDVGEIWFGKNIVRRIITWLISNTSLIRKDDAVIDIGCGNGMMLVALALEGYKNLHGVDYSPNAINLARRIASKRNISNEIISFKVCDFLNWMEKSKESYDNPGGGTFKLALDKGTYDAISMNPDDGVEKRKIYMDRVWKLLVPDGFFIIATCNWTLEEIADHFRKYFEMVELLPTTNFTFGGGIGKSVTCVIFKKKA